MKYTTLFLLCMALFSGCVQSLRLADGGSSNYSIYYSSNAPKSVPMAALDLQEYIYKACGTKLLIVNEPKPPMISLGDNPASRAAGLSIEDISLEGFRIETISGNLYILGPDTADGKRTAGDGSSAGTRNGVYYFLEQFIGVRWLMPGEHGDYIPQLASLEIPRICLTNAPFFIYRRVPYIQEGRPEVKTWEIRQKMGSTLNVYCGEAWEYIVTPDMFKQHPDWFAEQGGVRAPPIGNEYKLCISRDEVVQVFADAAISYFDKNPNRLSFSISPSDGYNWCECARCKVMYEKDPNGHLSVTPAVLTFYNKVAKLVAKKYPDKLLGGYVYQTYQFPPATPIKMEPNVFLTWAAEFDYGFFLYRPKIQKDWQRLIAQWTQVQTNLSYYDLPNNICVNKSCAPNPPGLKILKFIYPRLKQFNISGVYIYGCEGWGHGALVNYLLAKLAWNPDADPEMIFNEFCEKAYGAGAEEIKQFYRLLDDETERLYLTNNNVSWFLTDECLKDVYARNFNKLEQLYLAAQNKVVDDPEAKARLDMLGKDLTVLHWSLRQLNMAENPASSRFYLDNAAFHEFIKANINSLYIDPAALRSITNIPAVVRQKLTVAPITNVPNAEAATPCLLRDNQHLVIYPTTNSVRIGITDLTSRGAIVRCVVYNAGGEEILRGVFNPDVVFSITPADSPYYHLMITAGSASYRMNIQGAAWAIDGRIASHGFEFLQQVTPLYFEVPENLNSFCLQMETDAPGESALAVLYTPAGKEAAHFNCTVTPVDRQNISVGSSDSGIWKLVIKKAETGVLDDVFIKPGDEIPGYFSILPDKVLKIRAIK